MARSAAKRMAESMRRRRKRAEEATVPEPIPTPARSERAEELQRTPSSQWVTPAVRGAAAWAWRLAIISIVTAAIIYALIQIDLVVVPVFIAVLLASLLMPVVNWLDHYVGVPRALAAIVTMLLAFGAIGLLLTLAIRAIGSGIADLTDQAIEGLNQLIAWLSDGPLNLSEDQLQGYLQEGLNQVQSNAQQIFSGAVSVTTSVGQFFAGMLIAFFCLFFFLRDGRKIWTWVVGLTPVDAREKIDGASLRGWVSMGQYVRMQIFVAFIDGLGIGLGAYILGSVAAPALASLALPLGVLVFIGSFVPIIGAVLTGSIAVLVALVSGEFWVAIVMLAIVLGVQQLEGNVLQPFLMGKALKLHPVAVLLTVTAGTILGGIVGAALAVPIMAAANSVMLYLHGRDNAPEDERPGLENATARMREFFKERERAKEA